MRGGALAPLGGRLLTAYGLIESLPASTLILRPTLRVATTLSHGGAYADTVFVTLLLNQLMLYYVSMSGEACEPLLTYSVLSDSTHILSLVQQYVRTVAVTVSVKAARGHMTTDNMSPSAVRTGLRDSTHSDRGCRIGTANGGHSHRQAVHPGPPLPLA